MNLSFMKKKDYDFAVTKLHNWIKQKTTLHASPTVRFGSRIVQYLPAIHTPKLMKVFSLLFQVQQRCQETWLS